MYSKLLVVPKQFLGIYFITKPKFAQWEYRKKAQKYRKKNGYFNLRVHEMNAADWEIEKIYIFEKLM